MIVNHAHPELQKVNTILRASKDVSDAIEQRRERIKRGQFRWMGLIEAIIFEPDRAFNPTKATADAKRVGRRLYWPAGIGPAVARTIPEGDLVVPYKLKLPLPDVPDLERDDPNRKPLGDTSDPAKGGLWKPGDPVEGVPMMKQRMERVASAKFGPFLVFQPVAQIQFIQGGARATGPQGMMGATQHAHATLGNAQFAAAGSHRMPISSMRAQDDRVMSLLIDPNDGEMLFLFGRYNVDLKG